MDDANEFEVEDHVIQAEDALEIQPKHTQKYDEEEDPVGITTNVNVEEDHEEGVITIGEETKFVIEDEEEVAHLVKQKWKEKT